MNINEALDKLLDMACKDETLRAALIATENAPDPMDAFCIRATQAGCPIDIGELFALNELMLNNLLKSVNGGATYPIEDWGDCYEQFISSLKAVK
jgi:hypothetical protein